jgi:hypothetical protein
MRKKLCFSCRDPWVPEHRCMGKGQIHYIEVESGSEEEGEDIQAPTDSDSEIETVIARFVGKVQGLESGLETGVTGASPPTVTSMGSSFYLGGQVQGRRP